ncbi:hypothetical protein BH11PLA2_BH11PLA2_19630 [soil metagenome]
MQNTNGSTSKCATTIGIFDSREAADRAIADLRTSGFKDDEISHVWKKRDGETIKTDGSGMSSEEKGAATGATAGAIAGAAGGAAVGYGVLAGIIPVIGPILAVGALGTILLNAAGGAAIASISGALIGWGASEDEAKYYEGQVAAGKHLVTVNGGERCDKATSIYSRNGGTYRTPLHSPALKV